MVASPAEMGATLRVCLAALYSLIVENSPIIIFTTCSDIHAETDSLGNFTHYLNNSAKLHPPHTYAILLPRTSVKELPRT